jgi:anti-sigma B factor antagonist
MNISTAEAESVPIATLSGDIDGKTAPDAQGRLLEMLTKNPRLVLDMTKVGFLSSAGLRVMLLLYRQAAARNGRIVLVGLSEEIKDTMSMTGFLRFFTVAGSVDEGARLLAGG